MKALALVALVAAIGLAGCTDTGKEYEVPPQDADGNYIIQMGPSVNHLAFSPRYAEVPVGATVIWEHQGSQPHNVVSGANGKDAGVWQAGAVGVEDFTLIITEEMLGEQPYYCAPHWSGGMYGGLKVVSASA